MTAKPDSSKMEYRYLGPTGLKVSVLSNWSKSISLILGNVGQQCQR